MAKLLGIAIKSAKYAPMQELASAEVTPEKGIIGDHRGKPGKRQITVMSLADWNTACTEVGKELPWLTRRANLLVDDLPWQEMAGSRLLLGDVVLEITGETDPCQRMETACPGLFNALHPGWRGGVTCRVLRGGNLHPGMDVILEPT